MRVCIVTESFLPVVNGVTNSVLRVLEHLRAEGHEALVIAPHGSIESYAGFDVAHMPAIRLRKHGDIRVGIPSPLLTKRMRDFQPDVVHLASPFALGGYATRSAASLGLPTVAVFQTDVAGFALAYGFGGLTSSAVWRYVARLHGNVDRTLAPSTASMEQLAQIGVSNVHLWRRGVDSARFAPSRRDEDLRRQWGAPQRKLVGYVGRLAAEKRAADLASLDGRDDIRLVFIGDGPERAALQRRFPDAVFTGFLGGTELAAAVASLDVFVHTGPNETFCQSVQESLASGVPVVAVNQGGPRDLVEHGVTGYLTDTSNPAMLRAAVDELLVPGRRDAMGAAARRSVEHRTWRAINDELLEHYRQVIGLPVGVMAA